MKNTGFKKKPRKALKRTPFKAKTALRPKKRATGKNTPKKGKSIPNWIRAIPESQAHGSGTYQKRLWKIVSDYVRIRDWYEYKVCAATGARIEHWSYGQAGHLKPYSKCNALFKFDVRNIHMQSSSSNKWGNWETFKEYETVVRNRGYDFDAFVKENEQARGASLRDGEVIEHIKKMLIRMEQLPEKPAYFERVVSLME